MNPKKIPLTIFLELAEDFDFEEVENMMKAVNWCWSIDGIAKVPTILQMKEKVADLFSSLWKLCEETNYKQQLYSSSGGFKVTYIPSLNDVDSASFRLEFVFKESEIFIDNA
jgi:hypothetical protein